MKYDYDNGPGMANMNRCGYIMGADSGLIIAGKVDAFSKSIDKIN